MLHPHTELRFVNDVIGYGVFATRPIPMGTITWVRCDLDQILSPERVAALEPHYAEIVHKYSFVDGRGDFILCWDLGRFVNHHCEANCRSAGYEFEVAIRDIAAGEELTDDYGSLNLEYGFECHCRSPRCRGRVLPEDTENLADEWDALVEGPVRRIRDLEQPLWPFYRNSAPLLAALEGREPIRSCRLHFAGDKVHRRA